MIRSFHNDDRARVSFAVIAVIILIGATVTGAYVYTLSKQGTTKIDIPTSEFGSLKNAIDLELLQLAKNALIEPLGLLSPSANAMETQGSGSDAMANYKGAVVEKFQALFDEHFNGTTTINDISTVATLLPPTNGGSYVTPTYDHLSSYTEEGASQEQVPVGFALNASVDISMKDQRTGTRAEFTSVVVTNITTMLPTALSLYDRFDLSTMDSLVATMVEAVIFARAYGTYGEEMSYLTDNIPKPGENFSSPRWTEDNDHVLSFGTDVGPISRVEILSNTDFSIIQGLAYLLAQIRFFGTADTAYIQTLLELIHNSSISDEGRKMTQADLEHIIGTTVPNYVNTEAFALEVFHEMGRIPEDVDLVVPIFKKLVDMGIMADMGSDWDLWQKNVLTPANSLAKYLVNANGWLVGGWMPTDEMVGLGYQLEYMQFVTMVLGYIFKAYHLDKPDEVTAFVEDFIRHNLKDGILKDVPDTIKIPPGKGPGLVIKPKAFVDGLVDKAVSNNLLGTKTTDLMGLKFNGYTLIYLFINKFTRPDFNDSSVGSDVSGVYDNWTTRLERYIQGQNLSSMHQNVSDDNRSFYSNMGAIGTVLASPVFDQYSSNDTVNSTVRAAVDALERAYDNMSGVSQFMVPEVKFFDYGQGNETDAWDQVEKAHGSLDYCGVTFGDRFKDLKDLKGKLNTSSSDYDLVNRSIEELLDTDSSILGAEIYMHRQLNDKWELDLLEGIWAQLNLTKTTGSKVAVLYESVGILSNPIGSHPTLDFPWTNDDLSGDVANVSTDAKEFSFMDNGTRIDMSIKDLINDKRGVNAIKDLLENNILDLKDTFSRELGRYTTLNLVGNGSAWPSHKSYGLADHRLLYEEYNTSILSLEAMRDALEAESAKYLGVTPDELWTRDHSLSAYAELSYIDLKLFTVNVLINKTLALQEVYRPMEMHPGWAATFRGISLGTAGETFPLQNITFELKQSVPVIQYQGERAFNNTSSVNSEDILFEYLNPFSNEWQDYYLTNIALAWTGLIKLGLTFNETNTTSTGTNMSKRFIETLFQVDCERSTTMITPEPVVDIGYAPTASFTKQLRTLTLERNVFSYTWNRANVNFTYVGASKVRPDDNKFKVQVMALTRSQSIITTYGLGLVESLLTGDVKPANARYLTKELDVTDNGPDDKDPALGVVNFTVSLDLKALGTNVGFGTMWDTNPLLLIKVWKGSMFLAQMSQAMLSEGTGEKQKFSCLPDIEQVEQGYFSFDYTEDPMIGVYDVGRGDKEVDVPWEIALNTLPTINHITDLIDAGTNSMTSRGYPRDDPHYWGLYNLTCEFKAINDIPTDSAVVVTKGIPMLVDFDRGHIWMRNMLMGLIATQKYMSELEELVYTALTPRKTAESMYVGLLPASEYKFALYFDFMPVYIQYLQGLVPPLDIHNLVKGQDLVITPLYEMNPDLAHIPFRVIPINLDRGLLTQSLWFDLLDELARDNISMNFFIYDIAGFVMREVSDIAGLIGGFSKIIDDKSITGSYDTAGIVLKYFSLLQKTYSDTLKNYKNVLHLGRIVLASPGAIAKKDYGNFIYLGFDIGTNSSKDTVQAMRVGLTYFLKMLGLWYDIKAILKVTLEFLKYINLCGDSIEAVEENGVNTLEKTFKDFGTYLTVVSKYYASMNPSKGSPKSSFKPAALYSIEQKYKMTDEEMQENNKMAWKYGYSVVDISYLRHRNMFTVEQLRDLKEVRGLSAAEVQGLACVVDLKYKDLDYFNGLNQEILVSPDTYCHYGKRTMAQWSEVRDAVAMGISLKDLWEASNNSIPYNALMSYKQVTGEVKSLIDKIKIVNRYPGHETLLGMLGKGTDGLSILEGVYLIRDNSMLILPVGKDGPDIVLPDKVAFGLTYHGNGKAQKKSQEFLEAELPSVMNRTDKPIWLYIDLRFGSYEDRTIMKKAIDDALPRLDKDGQVLKVTLITSTEVHSYLRTDKGLKEVGP